MENLQTLYKMSLSLRPAERLKLIELIARSLDKEDDNIEKIWAEEAEKRYDAYINGKVKTISLDEVIERYKKFSPHILTS